MQPRQFGRLIVSAMIAWSISPSAVQARPNAQSAGDQDSQSRDLVAAFQNADSNRDGVLSRGEWNSDPATFDRVDRNHDGRVSLAEFLGEGEPQSAVRQAFDTLDRNHNGVITRNEWTGDPATFVALDVDGDGVIARAEYDATREAIDTPAYRAGYERGLTEGRKAGHEDRYVNGGRWDLEGQREQEQADSGYVPSLGSRAEYQAGYRSGFRRGYQQGFGPR